jgi:hypothetical protein
MRSVGLSPLDVTCQDSFEFKRDCELQHYFSGNIAVVNGFIGYKYEEVHVQLWTHDGGGAEVTFDDLFLVTRRDTESSLKEAFDQDVPPGSKLHIGHAPNL